MRAANRKKKPMNGTKNKTCKHTQLRGPAGKKTGHGYITTLRNPTTAVPPEKTKKEQLKSACNGVMMVSDMMKQYIASA